MLSEEDLSELIIGPAIVVDDKVFDATSGIAPIIAQIEEANIPVFKLATLPPIDQVRHWRGFSLIVLDWELFPGVNEDPHLPAGLAMPSGMTEDSNRRVVEFVERLLSELYCPLFIFSSESVDEIWNQLTDRIQMDPVQLRSRILVRSKTGLEATLLKELAGWISAHPAIYALKSWESGYERAKQSVFADFQASSASWPNILWQTSSLDSVDPNFELAETISRNILHRFPPLQFDVEVLTAATEPATVDSLRSVLHNRAVIAKDRLYDNVLMPGDFFFQSSTDGPEKILINVTPACDLVPRSNLGIDSTRLVLVSAKLIGDDDLKTRRQVDKVNDSTQSLTEDIIFLLTATAKPYRIGFKDWDVATWGEMRDLRQGRLLDPYITQLQQKFALYFHRQGIPRLPDPFYYNPAQNTGKSSSP